MNNTRHAALHGLIDLLPEPGSQWDQQRRDQFLRVFELVLDFSLLSWAMTTSVYTPPPFDTGTYSPNPVQTITSRGVITSLPGGGL